MPVRTDFDDAYYARFYGDPDTRVVEDGETTKLARFVLSYLEYLGVTIRSVLDLGCGNGRWGRALHELHPALPYTGVEISEAMCARHGWHHGSAADWRGDAADLVVCHGVLQYLSDADAQRAIDNFARHADKALYVEVVTREDWDHNVDQRVTDGDIHLRRAKWYRKHLAKHFDSAGGGVYVPKKGPVVLYELEKGA